MSRQYLTPMQTDLIARRLASPGDYLFLRGAEYTSWTSMLTKGIIAIPDGGDYYRAQVSEDGKARFFAGRPNAFWVETDGGKMIFDRQNFFMTINSREKADRIVKGLNAIPD